MAARSREKDGSKEVAEQIREYQAGLSPATRRVLKSLQSEVRAAAPAAKPAFSYRIPAFAIDGKILVWCAGWKDYVSMYPITKGMREVAGTAMAPFEHGKGTLRFALTEPLPTTLIRRLVKARLAEMKQK